MAELSFALPVMSVNLSSPLKSQLSTFPVAYLLLLVTLHLGGSACVMHTYHLGPEVAPLCDRLRCTHLLLHSTLCKVISSLHCLLATAIYTLAYSCGLSETPQRSLSLAKSSMLERSYLLLSCQQLLHILLRASH
jgi:hypothetical protein